MITNKKYNAGLIKMSDKNLLIDFANEKYSDEKATGYKRSRDRILLRLLKSPAVKAGPLKEKFFQSQRLNTQKKQKQDCFHLIFMNFVVEEDYYYKRNKPELIQM